MFTTKTVVGGAVRGAAYLNDKSKRKVSSKEAAYELKTTKLTQEGAKLKRQQDAAFKKAKSWAKDAEKAKKAHEAAVKAKAPEKDIAAKLAKRKRYAQSFTQAKEAYERCNLAVKMWEGKIDAHAKQCRKLGY